MPSTKQYIQIIKKKIKKNIKEHYYPLRDTFKLKKRKQNKTKNIFSNKSKNKKQKKTKYYKTDKTTNKTKIKNNIIVTANNFSI